MTRWTRRTFLATGGLTAVAACTSQPAVTTQSSARRDAIDAAVAQAMTDLNAIPGAPQLVSGAQGVLIIPNIRQAGFWVGGAYGEGALLIGPATVAYYSMSMASFGFTFGAAAFNQALFFMTKDALEGFRVADGWSLGVDGQVVGGDSGASAGASTLRSNRPIQELIFAQRGLIANVSLAGAKYNIITP